MLVNDANAGRRKRISATSSVAVPFMACFVYTIRCKVNDSVAIERVRASIIEACQAVSGVAESVD
jgi:hypothetical protein